MSDQRFSITVMGKKYYRAADESLLEALRRNGLELESPCNGQGICGKCAVRVTGDGGEAIPNTPHEILTPEKLAAGYRLICKCKPISNVTIILENDISSEKMKIIGGDHAAGIVNNGLSVGNLSPAAVIVERDGNYFIEYRPENRTEPLCIWSKGGSPKGLAIDVGTTTLVVSLFSLTDGKELGTVSMLNPQVRFGHDVMSRIQKGSERPGLDGLARAVRNGINTLIERVCWSSSAGFEEIVDVVASGNSTMIYLLAGVDPAPLGQLPFKLNLTGNRNFPATGLGLKVNPAARVYVPPLLHAFIGSDISAGLLAINDLQNENETVLFIDVGTNGEICLRKNGRWLATSAAAGPAFEGMGIGCGMRALSGAVEAVWIEDRDLRYETVFREPARGICGSGIVDLLACLIELGIVEASGRMRSADEATDLPSALKSKLRTVDSKPAFFLGENVYLTQSDVRQIQLAKSAIRTAIDMLLDRAAVEMPDRVWVAGGFGYHLKPESLAVLGMLNPNIAAAAKFVGNTCLVGSARLLLDASLRAVIGDRSKDFEHFSLALDPRYMDAYIGNLEFSRLG